MFRDAPEAFGATRRTSLTRCDGTVPRAGSISANQARGVLLEHSTKKRRGRRPSVDGDVSRGISSVDGEARDAARRMIAHGDEAVLANLVQRRLARAVKVGLRSRRSGRGRAKARRRRYCSAQCGYSSGCGCRRAGRRRSACGRCRSERGFRPPARPRCPSGSGIMIRAVGLIEWWEQVRHHSSSVVGSSS